MKNKGFTLIELIVIIAVLAILVLLATPKFLNYTKDAKLTQIINDVKVTEGILEIYLIKNNDTLPPNGTSISSDAIKTEVPKNKVFDTKGLVQNEEQVTGSVFEILSKDFVKKTSNSKLNGEFIASSKGKVYYIHDKAIKDVSDKSPEDESPEDEWKCITETKTWPEPLTVDEIDDLINQGYIPVASAKELNQIREENTPLTFGKGTQWEGVYVSGLDKSYIQVQDIDLSEYDESHINYGEGKGWQSLGTDYDTVFTGNYNGGNFDISNLYMKYSDGREGGLFGVVGGNVIIENIKLNNVIAIHEDYSTGGGYAMTALVGFSEGSTITMNNIKINNAEFKGSEAVGALVGYADDVTLNVNNISANNVKIEAKGLSRVGLLVGHLYSTNLNQMTNVEVTGSINALDGESEWVGGVVGHVEGDIRIEKVKADIEFLNLDEANSVGVVTGLTDGYTEYYDVEAVGDISVKSGEYLGGLTGSIFGGGQIVRSSYVGNISGGSSIGVGGLAGEAYGDIDIVDSYTAGSLSGGDIVAGYIGEMWGDIYSEMYGDIKITNSHSVMDIEGTEETSSVGSIIGEFYGRDITMTNTYYTSEASSLGGTRVTLEEMSDIATFEGWDFEQHWAMGEEGYPVFNKCINGSPNSNR